MFAPLHVKSEFSYGYGTAPVEQLARRAAGWGLPALALTDLETLAGQVRFHHAAVAWGVKPVTGVELRAGYGPGALGARAGRIVLLARDRAGYESLCRIVSARRAAPAPTPDPLTCLQHEPRGVWFLTDDPVTAGALRDAGVAREDLRFLLVRPGGAPAPDGVRAVADTDAVMGAAGDHALHAMLVAIRTGRAPAGAAGVEPPDRALAGPARMRARFADAPDALREALAVAETCRVDLTRATPAPAPLDLPAGVDADARLERLARERLASGRRAGRWRPPVYLARLDRELLAVRGMGLAGWFVAVTEIADHARSEGIRVMARGSAVGALLAHVLGFSEVDPVAHGLYFERFLHAGRAEPPDVDLDVPSTRRDALITWVLGHFGPGRAALAGMHVTFRRRGAWRAVLRALAVPAPVIDRFARGLPTDELEGEVRLPEPLHLLPAEGRAAAALVARVTGRPHHLAAHPGGVVLAAPRVHAYAPLERAPKGVVVTQYDMHALGQLGLVKVDLLGSRALAALEDATRWTGPVEPADEDPATCATLARGDTIGCPHVETPALRSLLRRAPVRGIADLGAVLALVRPGPASGDAKTAFVRRARGEERPEPPHPRLARRLAASHGLLLYEEDLMASLAILTGWSLEHADAVRAELVRHAGDPATLASLRQAFVHVAVANAVDPDDAAHVWGRIARFAAYAFNKAHASAQARLAWEGVWMRTHHPVAWACGVLDHYGGAYPLRSVAAAFVRAGVRILAPDVQRSDAGCRPESDAVRLGLGRVRRLGPREVARLLAARPFRDVADLLARVPLSAVQREALVLSGACDDLPPLTAERYPFAHEALLARLRDPGAARPLATPAAVEPAGAPLATYRALVRAWNEVRFLGVHPSAHPMAVLRAEARRAGCAPLPLAAEPGTDVRVAGVVAATRRVAARGGVLQFVTLEDEHGTAEVVLTPPVYAALRDPVRGPGPWIVEGRVAGEPDDPHLEARSLLPFHERQRPYAEID